MVLTFKLALKYLTSKYRRGFISFSGWVTIMGITMGIASLILTSSIMNGLQHEIKQKLYVINDQIVMYPMTDIKNSWLDVNNKIKQINGVKYCSPFIETYGLIQIKKTALPVLIQGINPDDEKLSNPFIQDINLHDKLSVTSFDFIMSEQLVNNFNLRIGDQLRLILPKFHAGIIQGEPLQKNIHLSDAINVQYGVNNQMIYMNIQDVMLMLRQPSPTGFKIRTSSVANVSDVVSILNQDFPDFRIVDWSSQNQLWFENLTMQKRVFSIFLSLLILVSLFSLVANLSMLVVEKQSEIAILKSLGASDALISNVFLLIGFFLTILGISIGSAIGLGVVYHIDVISQFIETLFNVKFFSPQLWPISFVPWKIDWNEISLFIGLTLFLGTIVAFIPARKVMKIDPAILLSYEG
ncbi:MAG: hypothetical protein CMF42_01235 [Legionellales bacterium]|nr:hypothetical protein [Legionellales bacterium]|tara:strand:- start:1096 stop:2325 length:1230 start_codon:yes stop_codon:yes gene_type:complete